MYLVTVLNGEVSEWMDIGQNLPNDPVAPLGGEVCLYFSDSLFHVLQNAACLPRICWGIREI